MAYRQLAQQEPRFNNGMYQYLNMYVSTSET